MFEYQQIYTTYSKKNNTFIKKKFIKLNNPLFKKTNKDMAPKTNLKPFRKISILFFALISVLFSNAQGKLLLMGGGSETTNGWSDSAFLWALSQVNNKKVVVISYDAPSNYIKDRFKALGAAYSRNFQINSVSSANLQSTYDTIISYDIVFLKGGDQANYYETYKNTLTQQALQWVYNNGGLLAGTSAGTAILSSIVFTAENGSVYPDECIQNPQLSYIVLKNDFLSTLPDYIFDSHFIERGRLGRLAAFMANWYFNHSVLIKGIGVDDKTAIGITANGIGHVMGTAAVTILSNLNHSNPYGAMPGQLRANAIQYRQLLHGCNYNFNTGDVSGLSNYINTSNNNVSGNYTILLSGSDIISENYPMLNHLINNIGTTTDSILIFTDDTLSTANSINTYLNNNGATFTTIFSANSGNQTSSTFATAINSAKKILICDIEYPYFMDFINGGSNGTLLKSKMQTTGITTAFMGDNSRFAGKSIVHKYDISGASYYGEMEVNQGLNLLQHTAVIPKTYLSSTDLYENTISALPYAMVTDSLTYGIWIMRNSFVKYYVNENNQGYFKHFGGSYPTIVLKNQGTFCDLANMFFNPPRNIAGFESMIMTFLGEGEEIRVDTASSVNINKLHNGTNYIKLFPNPAIDHLNINFSGNNNEIEIYAITGRLIYKTTFKNTTAIIPLNRFSNGLYIIKTINLEDKSYEWNKFIIKK